LAAPNDVVFVVGGRSIRNRLHMLEESNLGLVEKSSHDERSMEYDWR
jgi:hypothetical protein